MAEALSLSCRCFFSRVHAALRVCGWKWCQSHRLVLLRIRPPTLIDNFTITNQSPSRSNGSQSCSQFAVRSRLRTFSSRNTLSHNTTFPTHNHSNKPRTTNNEQIFNLPPSRLIFKGNNPPLPPRSRGERPTLNRRKRKRRRQAASSGQQPAGFQPTRPPPLKASRNI